MEAMFEKQLQFFNSIGLSEVRAYSSFPWPTRVDCSAFEGVLTSFQRSWFRQECERCPQVRLLHEHDYLALASAVEFAEKDSLPTTQQQLAVFERNGDA